MTLARRILTLLALAAPLPAFAPAARAEDPPTIESVQWGWDSCVPAGRWVPVRVVLRGGPLAQSGILTLEHAQDSTQSARISVPATTTPGKSTPVDILTNMPLRVTDATITWTTADSKPQTLSFDEYDAAATGAKLPAIFGDSRGIILSVGRPSVRSSFTSPGQLPTPPEVQQQPFVNRSADEARWMQTSVVDVKPDELPITPMAFDALEAIVVDACDKDSIDPRSIAAIHEWVRAGGKLVLMISRDGTNWRRWLPAGPEGELVAPAPLADIPIPEAPAKLLKRLLPAPPIDPNSSGQFLPADPESYDPKPAVSARILSLSPAALRHGWAIRWTTNRSDSSGLIAEGPLGLGMVAVVGVDPSHLPAKIDARASRRLWQDALSTTLTGYLARPLAASPLSSPAVTEALDTQLRSLPPLNPHVFRWILISIAAFAFLIGPVDLLILSRFRARQRSWLSALGWISLATIAAFLIPPRVRSAESQHGSTVVIDAVLDPATPNPRAYRTGVTGILAGTTIAIQPSAETTGWWHGTSASRPAPAFIRPGAGQRLSRVFGALETFQAPTPAGESANIPQGFRMGPWTHRALIDQRSVDCPIHASLSLDGGLYRAQLTGLPAGQRPVQLTLYTWTGPSVMTPDSDDPQGDRLDASAPAPDFAAGSGGSLLSHRRFDIEERLPGATTRNDAMDARLKTGAWALLEISIRNADDGPSILGDARGFAPVRTTRFRLLVPVQTAHESRGEPK